MPKKQESLAHQIASARARWAQRKEAIEQQRERDAFQAALELQHESVIEAHALFGEAAFEALPLQWIPDVQREPGLGVQPATYIPHVVAILQIPNRVITLERRVYPHHLATWSWRDTKWDGPAFSVWADIQPDETCEERFDQFLIQLGKVLFREE